MPAGNPSGYYHGNAWIRGAPPAAAPAAPVAAAAPAASGGYYHGNAWINPSYAGNHAGNAVQPVAMAQQQPMMSPSNMNVLASLVGAQPTAMSAGASDFVRHGLAPIQPAMAPGTDVLARGVVDHSIPYLLRVNDAGVQRQQGSKNEKLRMEALREQLIREQWGQWGKGGKPYDPNNPDFIG